MARSTKVHCACGTPMFSVSERGIEVQCECGEKTLIPYRDISGLESFADFLEHRAATARSAPRPVIDRGKRVGKAGPDRLRRRSR